MSKTAPLISVIIVNYDSGQRLFEVMRHLAAQTFRNFEVIVINNGPRGSSPAKPENDGVAFTLIEAGENLGFAAANNRAAKRAAGEWLAFLNPDAYPAPDWLEELTKGVRAFPNVDAFGSTQIMANDPERLDGAGDAYFFAGVPYRGHYGWPAATRPETGESFAPCAAAAFYRRGAFEALGGFEERFFCYGEDVDLGFRLRLAGGRIVQLTGAIVRHEGSGVTGHRSDFTMYHGHRNRIWTYLRDTPLLILVVSFPIHLAVNFYLIFRFALTGGLAPYLRAMRDAAAGAPQFWRERRALHVNSKASAWAIAKAMTWSPVKLFRHEADIRPCTTS